MGAVWFRGSEWLDFLTEMVGWKLGLSITADDLKSTFERRQLGLWPDDLEASYRIRSEVVEHVCLVVLAEFGDPDARRVEKDPFLVRSVSSEFPDLTNADEVIDFVMVELPRMPISEAKLIDPRPLLDTVGSRWGPRSALLAIRFLEEMNARLFVNPWGRIRRRDYADLAELSSLFESESMPKEIEVLFDQRFTDYLSVNLDRIAEIHWRQFEGLVGEFLRRIGLVVEMGPGRNDNGVDIRAWDPARSEGSALLIVQCKRERRKVEKAIVKALAADVMFEGATMGMVATTAEWSEGARTVVNSRSYPIIEANQQSVARWIKEMRTVGAGDWLLER